MRVEAACNHIVPPEAWLDWDDYRAMYTLGWHRATSPRPEKVHGMPDPDGSPNFFIDAGYPVDSGNRTTHGAEIPNGLQNRPPG
jgi:hypothetical protein